MIEKMGNRDQKGLVLVTKPLARRVVAAVVTSAAVLVAAPAYAYAAQSGTAQVTASSTSSSRAVIRVVSQAQFDRDAASGFRAALTAPAEEAVCDLTVNNPHKSTGAKGKNIVIYKTRVTCDYPFRAHVNGELTAGVHIGPNPIVATSNGPTASGAAGKVLTWYTPAEGAAKQVICKHGAYYQGYSTAVVTTGAVTTTHSNSSNRVTAC
jgi:hypothetical protein